MTTRKDTTTPEKALVRGTIPRTKNDNPIYADSTLFLKKTSAGDCLKYQVGRIERRPATYPIYKKGGGTITGYRKDITTVPVFHLIGLGATIQRAEELAAQTLQDQQDGQGGLEGGTK